MDNLWTGKLVSFAYRYQGEAKPFKDMMAVFARMIDGSRHDCMMDVGCGGGRILRLIFEDLGFRPNYAVALDVSESALKYAQKSIEPISNGTVEYFQRDISHPDCFNFCSPAKFDLITAGLSIQYAEDWNEERGAWTTRAYERVLNEIYRLLKPGGKFVFSVNTPNPDFSVIAEESKKEIFAKWWRAPFLLGVALIMVLQGKKLTRNANEGRFHYLPIEQVAAFLRQAGFGDIRHELTYAGLAWVVSCRKAL